MLFYLNDCSLFFVISTNVNFVFDLQFYVIIVGVINWVL
jgi:hypothetical protein